LVDKKTRQFVYKYGIVIHYGDPSQIHYGDPSQIHYGKSVRFTTVSQSDSRWLTGQIHNSSYDPEHPPVAKDQ
jgi:hypothetical protein